MRCGGSEIRRRKREEREQQNHSMHGSCKKTWISVYRSQIKGIEQDPFHHNLKVHYVVVFASSCRFVKRHCSCVHSCVVDSTPSVPGYCSIWSCDMELASYITSHVPRGNKALLTDVKTFNEQNYTICHDPT